MLQTFTHQNLTLRYYDSEGSGPVLIFQHGLTGDHGQSTSTFVAQGYRLITLECRGHGLSDLGAPEELSIKTFASDLLALMDHLGLEKAALAGISMGAAITASIASTHPARVTSLTLVRPAWHDKRSPLNMNVYNVLADYLALYGSDEGKKSFAESETFQDILQQSSDNANSLLNTFAMPVVKTLHLLRRIACCAPGFNGEAIKAAGIPVKIAGTPLDVIHPLSTAKAIARDLGLANIFEVYPKSLDKEKHITEVTKIITSNIV
ncbi:TPA: alpha/beta fold hydrolase [Raoultella planticola]|nr:alpha/beta hydrolase [Klebsiella pneumoniae]